MDRQTLAILEEAIEPYRQKGFVITSQSEGAIILSVPPERFSYLFFLITLVLFWPIAAIYLISFNNYKNKQVCVRITSEGNIEETGYTLEAIEQERRRNRWIIVTIISILVLIVLALLVRAYVAYL